MECIATQLQDVRLIKPKLFTDARGFFLETWRQKAYDEALNQGSPLIFVQDNHSKSKKHILRGLHYQFLFPQGKLIRVIAGEIYDVIVDLRQQSSSFGCWQGFHISADNKLSLWVPPGFAHGFYTLVDDTEVIYKCTEYYHPEDEHYIIWDDPDLGIEWPLLEKSDPGLTNKDRSGVLFKEALYFATGTG